ncbi:ATP-dependent RNA helicase RhlE [Dehalogenimonas formicexedens]|uniref:RNA helicase n=1 Tax=Dehalogenimonas formicexedens TaxID=1839801 RepID=A0A1P8F8M7_9CHLR|nr:DEAD/DEAH box helicase [Dehalogenimonas formicexedens]APV44817.1 ATP-dependent RNA helicase RhlE [Dehalogenimonas formicexedens]
MTFEQFNLHPAIMDGIRSVGYSEPTPIQAQAIPPALEGRDLIGLAQTGTGKTAAFVLPMLQKLLRGPRGKLRGLIISPTRELAEQIYESIKGLSQHTGIRSMAIYGGVGMDPQKSKLRTGMDIVVACPGRLLDHVWQGTIDFTDVEMLVIDEADRMFDMGFLPDIRKILKCLMHERQTLLFSATMPDDVRKLVRDVLNDPVTVQIGQVAPANTVTHALYPVRQDLKTSLLKTLLKQTDMDSVLVFTRTKHRTERVALALAQSGLKVASIQGNLSQYRRQAALDGFKDGTFKVLVATDIASRGIDVSDVSHVINYDMPDTADTYIHRIGRTGRIGKTGDAFTFVCAEDEPMVKSIEKVLKSPIERRSVDGFKYDAPEPVKTAPPHQPRHTRPQNPASGSDHNRRRTPAFHRRLSPQSI